MITEVKIIKDSNGKRSLVSIPQADRFSSAQYRDEKDRSTLLLDEKTREKLKRLRALFVSGDYASIHNKLHDQRGPSAKSIQKAKKQFEYIKDIFSDSSEPIGSYIFEKYAKVYGCDSAISAISIVSVLENIHKILIEESHPSRAGNKQSPHHWKMATRILLKFWYEKTSVDPAPYFSEDHTISRTTEPKNDFSKWFCRTIHEFFPEITAVQCRSLLMTYKRIDRRKLFLGIKEQN